MLKKIAFVLYFFIFLWYNKPSVGIFAVLLAATAAKGAFLTPIYQYYLFPRKEIYSWKTKFS